MGTHSLFVCWVFVLSDKGGGRWPWQPFRWPLWGQVKGDADNLTPCTAISKSSALHLGGREPQSCQNGQETVCESWASVRQNVCVCARAEQRVCTCVCECEGEKQREIRGKI